MADSSEFTTLAGFGNRIADLIDEVPTFHPEVQMESPEEVYGGPLADLIRRQQYLIFGQNGRPPRYPAEILGADTIELSMTTVLRIGSNEYTEPTDPGSRAGRIIMAHLFRDAQPYAPFVPPTPHPLSPAHFNRYFFVAAPDCPPFAYCPEHLILIEPHKRAGEIYSLGDIAIAETLRPYGVVHDLTARETLVLTDTLADALRRHLV